MPRTKHTIDCDADPFLGKHDCVVEEHRRGGRLIWTPDKVSLCVLPGQLRGSGMVGDDVYRVMKQKPVLNANVLYCLEKRSHLIPEAWGLEEEGEARRFYFWGTIYSYADGRLYVRYLSLNAGNWRWNSRWLGRRWESRDVAVILEP